MSTAQVTTFAVLFAIETAISVFVILRSHRRDRRHAAILRVLGR